MVYYNNNYYSFQQTMIFIFFKQGRKRMGCCGSVNSIDEPEFFNSTESGAFLKIFSLGEKVGEGSYSVVHECIHRDTQLPFAVGMISF